MSFVESGMDFSPLFEQGLSVYIEKSNLYQNLRGNSVRSVEFISLRSGNRLCFIEAKSSFANIRNKDDFIINVSEILDKFQHSLQLYVSYNLGIHSDTYSEFPPSFNDVAFPQWKIIFLLVINGHKREWLGDVSEMLSNKLKALRKIMNIDVVVMNENDALKWKLIKETG